MNGFLLVNKPKGMTSHDVVGRVRRITGVKRVGHGGTLDPNATGLLIVGVGRENTKNLGDVSKGLNKTYEAEVVLGEERDTDDIEGEVVNQSSVKPALAEVKKAVASFLGEQTQIPPAYSAIKLKGKKAYELARQGRTVELAPRKINVYSLRIMAYKYNILRLECEVSSGTYIRALARDIGRALGTFAYLSNLKRTKIGPYDLKDAIELDDIETSSSRT